MKITLEQAALAEPEVVIRGDLNHPKIRELISALQSATGAARLFLYKDEKEYPHDFEEVQYFEADRNKVFARIGGAVFETRFKLYELAEMGRSRGFIQINKGVLVNVRQVHSVEAEFSGNYMALLKDQKTRLTISRKYMKAFRNYIMEVY